MPQTAVSCVTYLENLPTSPLSPSWFIFSKLYQSNIDHQVTPKLLPAGFLEQVLLQGHIPIFGARLINFFLSFLLWSLYLSIL